MWDQNCQGECFLGNGNKSVTLQHKTSGVAADEAGNKSWSLPAQSVVLMWKVARKVRIIIAI